MTTSPTRSSCYLSRWTEIEQWLWVGHSLPHWTSWRSRVLYHTIGIVRCCLWPLTLPTGRRKTRSSHENQTCFECGYASNAQALTPAEKIWRGGLDWIIPAIPTEDSNHLLYCPDAGRFAHFREEVKKSTNCLNGWANLIQTLSCAESSLHMFSQEVSCVLTTFTIFLQSTTTNSFMSRSL